MKIHIGVFLGIVFVCSLIIWLCCCEDDYIIYFKRGDGTKDCMPSSEMGMRGLSIGDTIRVYSSINNGYVTEQREEKAVIINLQHIIN